MLPPGFHSDVITKNNLIRYIDPFISDPRNARHLVSNRIHIEFDTRTYLSGDQLRKEMEV